MPRDGVLPPDLDPARAFSALRAGGGALPFLLDSGPEAPSGARSYLGTDPDAVLEFSGGVLRRREGKGWTDLREDPFDALGRAAADGGFWVGFLSYDVGRLVEGTPPHAVDDQPFPAMRFARYPDVLVFEHGTRLWRAERASERLPAVVAAALKAAPAGAGFSLGDWAPSVSREEYLAALGRAREAIRQGEIYQANLSHRFTAPFSGDPWAFYAGLRRVHPAPFSAYLEGDEGAIACLSPECFLERSRERLSTAPIKGTRPRFPDPARDAASRKELEESAKDRAELAMIVDLERNDLGRVAATGSVRVETPRRIVSYATVHHAESVVSCRLRAGIGWGEVLRAAFPGGSITGCPKIRAMEILAELEPFARGLYTGAIGWLSADAGCLNIAIRTVSVSGGRALLNVGGGIVADSRPDAEYEETLHKGKAFLSVSRLRQPGL